MARLACRSATPRPAHRRSCRLLAPPERSRSRRRIDDVTFDPFGLQNAMDPEAVEPGLLNHDDRKAPPGPRPRFLLSSAKLASSPATSQATTECFDIFSPAPATARCHFERLSSNETKIAPRSVRIGVGASDRVSCNGHACLQGKVSITPLFPTAQVATHPPHRIVLLDSHVTIHSRTEFQTIPIRGNLDCHDAEVNKGRSSSAGQQRELSQRSRAMEHP